MKLLLIVFLSTVSFIACGGNDTPIEPIIYPTSMTIDTPIIYKGVPTELTAKGVYENTTLNKTLTTEPTWNIFPVAPSEESDFILTDNILIAKKVGVEVRINAVYSTISDNNSVTVSTSTVTGISVTPIDPTIIANKTNIQLKATATFSDGVDNKNDQVVDITAVTDWSLPVGTSTMIVNNGENKGLVSATSKTVPTEITAVFGEQSNTSTVTALEQNSNIVDVKIQQTDFSLKNGLTNPLTAMATYSPEGLIDVTNLAVWSSSDTAIATVESITNKGLVTAKADSGTADISVVYGITNDKVIVTAKPAPIFNSFLISGTDENTVEVGKTNQLQTTETIDSSATNIKDIASSDYVCIVAEGVTAIKITENCLVEGVEAIGSVDITITNEKALEKSKTIQFAVTPALP